jgi:hypothetical protein
MVSGIVIDSRYKLWFAAAFTFALAICHEWLMSVRRRLVYKCVPCIRIPKLLCATACARVHVQSDCREHRVARLLRQREARTRGTPNGHRSETQLLLGDGAKTHKQPDTFWLDIAVAALYGVSLSMGYGN